MGSVDETSTSEGDGRKYQVKHHLKQMKVDISVTLGISENVEPTYSSSLLLTVTTMILSVIAARHPISDTVITIRAILASILGGTSGGGDSNTRKLRVSELVSTGLKRATWGSKKDRRRAPSLTR
jgi:hypothetical protein